jgi:hypothetical protein
MADYKYLEGKEFIFQTDTESIPCKVLYADYHIGLTCVTNTALQEEEYVICLRGPSSPRPHWLTRRAYQALWTSYIRQIERGRVVKGTADRVTSRHQMALYTTGSHLSSANCAFGQ